MPRASSYTQFRAQRRNRVRAGFAGQWMRSRSDVDIHAALTLHGERGPRDVVGATTFVEDDQDAGHYFGVGAS